MTNATVSGISAAPQGQMLKVTYKGGEVEVIIVPIRRSSPMFRAMPARCS
ncbi:MAG TPA: hypothetical protein VGF39_10660 [Stellaceae bacterium]